MADKKVVDVLFDTAILVGGMVMGAKLKDLVHQKQLVEVKAKLYEVVLKQQEGIIEQLRKSEKD